MNMQMCLRRLAVATFWLVAMGASGVHAQGDAYPAKPVRLVVDSAAGSANDATARILAKGHRGASARKSRRQAGAKEGASGKDASRKRKRRR